MVWRRARSAPLSQPEEGQDSEDYDDSPDQPNDIVHQSTCLARIAARDRDRDRLAGERI
jgi:hypothetical protein